MIYEKLKNDPAVRAYIKRADESLLELGYTEHSFAHATRVTEMVRYILSRLGYSERELDIACSAAYLHDIGNLINRVDHSQSGAMMAFRILDKMGVDPEDIATVVTAIGKIIFSTRRFLISVGLPAFFSSWRMLIINSFLVQVSFTTNGIITGTKAM